MLASLTKKGKVALFNANVDVLGTPPGMPGGVPRTSTLALNNATLPFLVKLANKGYQKALSEDKNFLAGLNVHKGQVTYKAVADVFGHNYVEPGEAIKH